MKVVFFGNHTVGVVALKALIEEVDIIGVVAHPEDPEEGDRYESVYDYAKKHQIPVIRAKGKEAQVKFFLQDNKPDLIWVTDYRYLLPHSILQISAEGAVNLHPSLLPKYRGRAPVNWAIIQGEKEIGLTAHFISTGMDDGDIIEQRSFSLTKEEDVGDALNKLMPLYYVITKEVIRNFIDGNVSRYKQNENLATTYKARKPDDGKINWQQTAVQIRDFIRAVATPYPGAFTYFQGSRLYIWKAELDIDINLPQENHIAGTVLDVDGDILIVACGEYALRVTQYTIEAGECNPINKGTLLN